MGTHIKSVLWNIVVLVLLVPIVALLWGVVHYVFFLYFIFFWPALVIQNKRLLSILLGFTFWLISFWLIIKTSMHDGFENKTVHDVLMTIGIMMFIWGGSFFYAAWESDDII